MGGSTVFISQLIKAVGLQCLGIADPMLIQWILTTVFQSYQGSGRVIMRESVQ